MKFCDDNFHRRCPPMVNPSQMKLSAEVYLIAMVDENGKRVSNETYTTNIITKKRY